MALTDSWLRKVAGKASEKATTKSDRDGLSARVSPKGKVTFQYRYRWDGKAERIDLGTYPATSLKEARDAALFYRAEFEQLRNPKIVKQKLIQQAISALTVEGVIRAWWEKVLQNKQVNAKQILRSFEIHVFPQIGSFPHDETDLHTWLSLVEGVVKKYPAVGGKVLQYAKLAHSWGVRRGLIKQMPLYAVTTADVGVIANEGDRTLSAEELRVLFSLIDEKGYNPRNKNIVKLCLLFGCRVGELIKAKVKDFDFNEAVWTVPAENHKTGRKSKKPIIRPITAVAREFIEGLISVNDGSEYLIPSPSGGHLIPGGHIYIGTLLNKKMAPHFENYKTWSMHDLRKTMRTGVSDLTMPHVAEIMLGHKLPGVWQVYDKHTYLEEQREAYEKWWDKVTRIVYRSPNQECVAS